MKSPSKNDNLIQQEFLDEAPFLSGFVPLTEKKESVPKDYFAQLPEQMWTRIKEAEQAGNKVLTLKKESPASKNWYTNFAPQHAIAASIFLAILAWSIFHYKSPAPASGMLAEIGTTEIQDYLIKHADEVDESLIQTLAEKNPLETIEKNQITLYLEENLSPEEIEEI